jgi:photosystem II stability/assembly factor-like uncharacterized protein
MDTLTIYAGATGRVFKSVDQGRSWRAASLGRGASEVHALVISPQDPQVLYAGTLGAGVFVSTDAGATWTQSSRGLGEHKHVEVEAVAIAPRSSRTVYAGTCDGVFQSKDGGANWRAVNTRLISTDIRALAIDPQKPDTLFAGTWGWYHESTTTRQAEPGGISKSLDSGGTWATVDGVLAGKDVAAIAIDPHDTEIVYAGTTDGLFWSSDGGTRWQAADLAEYVCALAIDSVHSEAVYAGTYSSGVFKSLDWGETLSAANLGLESLDIRALAIDPREPGIIYASTVGRRVFKTTDGGGNWLAIGPA